MEAENFVVKGRFFVPLPKDEEKSGYSTTRFIIDIKNMVIENLTSKGYLYSGPASIVYNYFELEFRMIYYSKLSITDRLFRFVNPEKKQAENYFKNLGESRDDIPWKVRVYLYMGNHKGFQGIFLDIISESAIFYKIVQLGKNPDIGKQKYKYVIYTNKGLVESVAKSIHSLTIDDPMPLLHFISTNVCNKLQEFGFVDESKLIEKGKGRIETGNIEDGLIDLRVALETFFHNIVKNNTELKPAPQDKIRANIEKLEKSGYLTGDVKGLLIKLAYNSLYIILSDQPTHKREPIKEQCNLFDARLFFELSENIIDYLLERVVRYNVKHTNVSQDTNPAL
ncbi:MAG: hypothetical protein ACOC1X_03350 [Promethearchaeota archaeon]